MCVLTTQTQPTSSLFSPVTLSRSQTLSQSRLTLSLSSLMYGTHKNTTKSSRIEHENNSIVIVGFPGAQPYHFQVSFPLISRHSTKGRNVHCSCTNFWLCFRLNQACSKLSGVPRKLGVLRWWPLDVGIAIYEVGRNSRFVRTLISLFLAPKSSTT